MQPQLDRDRMGLAEKALALLLAAVMIGVSAWRVWDAERAGQGGPQPRVCVEEPMRGGGLIAICEQEARP